MHTSRGKRSSHCTEVLNNGDKAFEDKKAIAEEFCSHFSSINGVSTEGDKQSVK